MELNTTSAVLTFYAQLGGKAAQFYEHLAKRYPEVKETFLALARETEKHRESVLRAYREAITDAFETGFSFTGLNEGNYRIETESTEDVSFSDAVRRAIEIEEKIHRFCIIVSDKSRGLQSDISHVFERAAKRSVEHKLTLEALVKP